MGVLKMWANHQATNEAKLWSDELCLTPVSATNDNFNSLSITGLGRTETWHKDEDMAGFGLSKEIGGACPRILENWETLDSEKIQ